MSHNKKDGLRFKSDATKGSVTTSVDVDTKIVTMTHHSNNKANKASFLLTWMLDFSGVTMQDLLLCAASNIVISIRRGFTDDKKPTAATWDNVTFDANDFVVRPSKKIAQRERIIQSLSKSELLAQLEALSDAE